MAKKAKAKTAKTAAKSKKAKTVAKTAAKPAKKGKITRREYTKEDIKELRAHSKARTPVSEIARLTKRTVGSLRQKALKLGIGLGHQR
ncbi:hypothetical protein [Rhodopseudomonas sp. B29]|uniref:hypothetical protein n=1 Tax=Rhodopseudomonas sp. B29 TaxID=95607 RepID=UPI00034D15ED|nr:hypothetical protein [Rhodopseudomonas sp. B29]